MFQLRALGVLDLRSDDDRVIRQVLAQPKRAALLTYLALAEPRGAHPRDKLLALFWPDQAPDQARNALSQAVHFLRRALGDDVIVSQNGDALGVAPALLWCDATAFDEAMREGKVAEALELYRGDFLEGFHVANAPDFERWLDGERRRLGERVDAALETLAAQCELKADYVGALAHRRRLAARAPYNSAVALRLMRTLAASGDPAAARQHAVVHEKLLRSELDVAPPAEITAFVSELQSSSAVPPPKAPVAVRQIAAVPVERMSLPSFWALRRRGVVILTAALVTACVGVAYAVATRDTTDEHLMALYEQGRLAAVNRSHVGFKTAVGHFRSAIARDSNFALGYAALSQMYGLMAHYDFVLKGPALDSARILANRAVSLDSTLPEARTALGVALANTGNFAAAEQQFRAAIDRAPDNPDPHYWYSMLLVSINRGKEALAEAETVLKLDPLAPRVATGMKWQATFLITGQRPHLKQPMEARRPILQLQPGEPWARAQQAGELAAEDRCADAQSEIATAQQLVPDSNMVMLAFAGSVFWSCGEHDKAHAVLDRMKRRADARNHGLRIAILYTRMGQKDSAFAWLSQHRWMMSEFAMLSAAQFVDPLRSDPRFPELMRSVGIR